MKSTSSKKIEKEFKNLRKNLLDLTLRNQLLNFKSRAKTLTVVNQSPLNIYQTLVLQNKKMYFVANKKEEKDSSKFSIWDHSPIDLSRFTEGDKTLQTNLTPNELQKRSFYINNQAKTMLQEQGYNILYLAVGFLEWYDNTKPKQKNLAPLILIPVSMERKKIGKSFELYWTGEDLQTNISLKAKLKENGMDLPEFEPKKYGEVIDHYIKKVKEVISPIKKWKVNSNIALGFFSFTKFVMYNDLNPESWEDNVDLTKNELIEAIFNPSKNKQIAFNEEDIDSELKYKNMYQVLDADSSQIAAIEDVKSGRNLVVEGPPGTGKSQTIVNLIAELLAEGKSVLFVSEKMAALDVVKDRLTKVGLGKFVLELHSHKTRKKKLLKELEKATAIRAENPLKVDQTIRKLETLRKQLDDYAEIIHEPLYDVKLSAFQLYGMKESADDHFSKKNTIIPLVRFSNPESLTLKDLDDIILSLENLAELHQTISKENPWSKCSPKSLLPADLREIELLINDTLHSLDNFIVEREKIYDIYGIKKPDTLKEYNNSLKAFELIESKKTSLIDGSILKSKAWNNPKEANKLIETLENYQRTSKILDKFNDNIITCDIDSLIKEVNKLANKKFRLFKNKQNNELVEIYYKGSIPSTRSILSDLKNVKENINYRKKLESYNDLAGDLFGECWHLDTKVDDLKSVSKWMKNFNLLIKEGIFSDNTIDLLSKDLFNVNPQMDMAEYIDAGNHFKDQLSKLESKLNPRSKLIFKKDSDDVSLERWREQLNNWRGQLSSLHLWSQYLNTKNACKGTDSEQFIETIEKRNIKKDDVSSLVLGNFADSLLNIIFVENDALATFIGELHENRIKEFKDLDKKILELNRKRIFHKLNQNIPKIFGATENPEAKVLAGEFTRKSGHLPVRKLLEKAGGIIKQIKPCFMMSPLSIAQYLDPTNEKLQFDVVIFDEASQVKPEDALGAFMRGKTAVVMGDTQQLPPTSFFEQIAAGESGEEVATSLDMESILHLCKLSFPVKMLKWHYRSRHESLISVSNKEFYDDELLVYPSPSHNDPELGLKFKYNPNTYYDRGHSSANREEAKDVAREVINHFDKYGDTKSLGVGTFSVAQKNAILEELEVERKQRPELEPLFSDNKEERFFVKNLETIQGDERDVILISIGYGFDENHKISLNFGPLNQDGGERRLNVLITRAREKCVVFSNFKAYDMQLTNNPPFGVKALKEFLEYAENLTLGAVTLEETSEEPFEDAIYSFLVENGYTVHKQIGCAGFRVDLAVVDEENPGKYVLGITTDGKMYSSSKVARDRDRLREQVLNGLGWKLYHLWSTDWYRNRDLGRKKLLDAVEKARKESAEEEKRKSKEAKILAEKRKAEAEEKAKELRIAKEKELAEIAQKEDNASLNKNLDIIDDEYISSSDQNSSNEIVVEDSSYELDELTVEDTSIKVKGSNNLDIEDSSSKVKDSSNLTANDPSDKVKSSNNSDIINPNEDIKENSYEDKTLKESNKKTSLKDKLFNFNKSKNNDISDDMNYSTDDLIEDKKDLKKPRKKSSSKDEGLINFIISGIKEGESKLDKKDLEEHIVDDKSLIEDKNMSPAKNNESNFSKIKFKSNIDIDEDHPIADDANGIAGDEDHPIADDANGIAGDEDHPIADDANGIAGDEDHPIADDANSIAGDEDHPIAYDVHNIATEIVDKSFEKVLKNNNPNSSDSLNEIEDKSIDFNEEDIQNNNNEEESYDDLNDKSISDLNEDISNNIQYQEVYKGVSDITNPLKKNNVYHDEKKSVLRSINDLKNEVKYINKSLKEIENPTPAEYVSVIDRTEEYNPDEYQSPYDEVPIDYVKEDIDVISPIEQDDFAEQEEERIRKEELMEALKKEIASDENVIIPIHQEEKKKNIEDLELENIIQDADESYKEIEKERFLQNNKLKAFDNKKLPKKGEKIEDNIVEYQKAEDIGIKSSSELYNKSINDLSNVIYNIVKVEGPVHIDEIIKRIKDSCNLKRAGSKLKKTVQEAIDAGEQSGEIIIIEDFLFDSSSNKVAIRKREKPNIDLISKDEIQKNIETILLIKQDLDTKSLTKIAARNFGFKSTSKKTANKINSVLDAMIAEGKVKIDNNILELN